MKIKKSELNKFIEKTTEILRKKHNVVEAEKKQAKIEALAKWEVQWGGAWDTFLVSAIKARKTKKPITFEMIKPIKNNRYGTDVSVQDDVTDDYEESPFVIPQDLLAMKNLLSCVADEEVDVKLISGNDLRALYAKYG
ncbi:MAG TPA: hypothetical protein VK796_12350 [Cytophaga sp.]|jgi:hypothetical protein|nr:hypothetical protein [Cytophaga sp.]